MGNSYVEVLLKGLDDMPVEKLNLRNNNLTGENVTKHLDNVLHVIDLDLSENRIGKSLLGLKQPIVSKNSQLRRLGLEKTQMSNHMAKSLLSWAEASESLKSLNIADNKLGDDIGESLISLISKNTLIEEIYLSWNNLSSQTAEPLFKALTPSSLKVLDLGWNQIGTNMKVVKKNADSSLAAICDCLVNNKSLVHLSLNNNGFSMDESTKISEALKKNKTIYGFHFSGNNGYVDYLGYLQLDVSPLDIQDSIRNTKLNGVAAQSFSYEIDPFENTILLKNCCWICEGWIELDIIYPDNLAESEPVFLLLKHENYQLIYIPPEDSGKRRVKIMVPRMKLFFCFFLSDQVQCHPDFATINLTSEETLSFEFLDQNYMFTVSSMNCLSFDCIQKPLFDSNFQVQCAAIPRTPREKYIPPKGAKNKRKWNFATSIFKTYKKDTGKH